MAIISKIRERAGWSIGIIAVALAMFVVGGDLLSSSSWLLGNNKQIVGSIDGKDIELQEFEREYRQLLARYQEFTGVRPDDNLSRNIRQQAWLSLLSKYVYGNEYEDLGVVVTDAELVDMIQGDNIDPNFANNFKDSTGQVDKNLIKRYLANIPDDQKLRYAVFEQDLRKNRLQLKYRNLITYSRLFTPTELEKEHLLRNSSANISYFYLPYYNIPDSVVAVSDAEVQNYYEAHLENYKTEPTRQIEYLFLKKEPSFTDLEDLKRELKAIKLSFQETDNDTNFVVRNNEIDLIPIDTFAVGKLADLGQADLEVGQTYGPTSSQNQIFKLYKVLETIPDTNVYSARALSISFSYVGKNEAEQKVLKQQVDSLLQVLKAGADFRDLGKQYNYADLGWRAEKTLQKELNDAIFETKTAGLVSKVIETSQSYYLLFVTHPKQAKRWVIAQMGIQAAPSDETIDSVFRQISIFYPEDGQYESLKNSLEDYKAETGDNSLFLIQSFINSPNDLNINNLTGNDLRTVFHWMYNDDTNEGAVSDFELESGFMLVALKSKNDAEYRPLKDIELEIKTLLKNRAKQNFLKNSFADKPESLETVKAKYPSGTIYENQTVRLDASSLQNVSDAGGVIGRILNLKTDAVSEPLFTENGGLVILKINSIDKAITLPTQNYDFLHRNLRQEVLGQYLDLTTNLDELVEIEKRLYLYY